MAARTVLLVAAVLAVVGVRAAVAIECPADAHFNGCRRHACVEIAVGKRGLVVACQECGVGYTLVAENTKHAACECAPGYGAQEGICKRCPADTHIAVGGTLDTAACLKCPPDMWFDRKTEDCLCPPGTHRVRDASQPAEFVQVACKPCRGRMEFMPHDKHGNKHCLSCEAPMVANRDHDGCVAADDPDAVPPSALEQLVTGAAKASLASSMGSGSGAATRPVATASAAAEAASLRDVAKTLGRLSTGVVGADGSSSGSSGAPAMGLQDIAKMVGKLSSGVVGAGGSGAAAGSSSQPSAGSTLSNLQTVAKMAGKLSKQLSAATSSPPEAPSTFAPRVAAAPAPAPDASSSKPPIDMGSVMKMLSKAANAAAGSSSPSSSSSSAAGGGAPSAPAAGGVSLQDVMRMASFASKLAGAGTQGSSGSSPTAPTFSTTAAPAGSPAAGGGVNLKDVMALASRLSGAMAPPAAAPASGSAPAAASKGAAGSGGGLTFADLSKAAALAAKLSNGGGAGGAGLNLQDLASAAGLFGKLGSITAAGR